MTINLHVTMKPDGRFSVKSPDVPGLFLASHDLSALARDVDVSVRDLLRDNLGVSPETIEYRFHSAEGR